MKKTLFLIFLLFLQISCFANDSQVSQTVIGNGIGIGSALAVSICWTRTRSVLISALAGLFGWLYVIYYLFTKENGTD
jgi:hypothetical protein